MSLFQRIQFQFCFILNPVVRPIKKLKSLKIPTGFKYCSLASQKVTETIVCISRSYFSRSSHIAAAASWSFVTLTLSQWAGEMRKNANISFSCLLFVQKKTNNGASTILTTSPFNQCFKDFYRTTQIRKEDVSSLLWLKSNFNGIPVTLIKLQIF